MASSHHPNNVEAAIEHKRVSFGGEEHVQMIVYDDGLTDDYTNSHQHNKYSTRHGMAFTEPDAPPSRVKVTAETAQHPRPISPPAQIGPSTMSHFHHHHPTTTTAAASPHTDPSVAGGSAAAASAGMPNSTEMVTTSPPLPSFVKRAEHDNENPFRPEENLYHEVDPIVEAYRQRPFPPSPTHGSPISSAAHQQQQQQTTSTTTTAWSSTTPTKRNSILHQHPPQQQLQYSNGGGGGRNNSLAQARRDQENAAMAAAAAATAHAAATTPQPIDGVAIGPPHKAELIHLKEEKKKRACCHLQ